MTKRLVCGVACAALLVGGCSDSITCDPRESDNPCMSPWDTDMKSCVACPESAGFSASQGYCDDGVYASEARCQELFGGDIGSDDGKCDTNYEGPKGDPQVATQCMSVWNYRCVQGNKSAADQNCRVYDSMEPTVSCPYCD